MNGLRKGAALSLFLLAAACGEPAPPPPAAQEAFPVVAYTVIQDEFVDRIEAAGTLVALPDGAIGLEISVPESDRGAFEPGQELLAVTAAVPGRGFAGTIETIAPPVSPAGTTLMARARINNDEGALQPGMHVTARLMRTRGNVLLVPDSALLAHGERQVVLVIGPAGAVAERGVTIGRVRPGAVEILTGLKAGETVVADQPASVAPGKPVRIVHTMVLSGDASNGP